MNALIQSILEVATQLTDTETASILLLNKKNGDFYFEMSMGENWSQADPIIMPFESSLAGWIVKNGEALVVDNVQDEDHFFGHHFSEIEKITHFDRASLTSYTYFGELVLFHHYCHTERVKSV